jgi:predicted RND superfamily exporter protein
MSDTGFVLGAYASMLVPAVLVAWLVRRWFRRLKMMVLALVLIGGAAWLGLGAFVGQAFSDVSVNMDG